MNIPNENKQFDDLVAYTCIFGTGYSLPDIFYSESVRFICFTDQDNLVPNGWEIVQSTPILKADLARSSREHKIRPHRYLREFKRSIYIDPSVEIIANPHELWNFLMGGNDSSIFGALLHSFRGSVLEEFEAVYHHKLDSTKSLEEHLNCYVLTNPDGLKLKPIWAGMIARRHLNPICVEIMERWFCNVMRYSRRDQLSLPALLDEVPAHLKNLRLGDIHATNYHRWPVRGYSKPPHYLSSVAEDILPAIIRAEKLVIDNRKLLAERDAIINSRSWKLTGWYRQLGKIFKKLRG